jgi:hypothetical protein
MASRSWPHVDKLMRSICTTSLAILALHAIPSLNMTAISVRGVPTARLCGLVV